jgi:hypothetical protein
MENLSHDSHESAIFQLVGTVRKSAPILLNSGDVGKTYCAIFAVAAVSGRSWCPDSPPSSLERIKADILALLQATVAVLPSEPRRRMNLPFRSPY